MSGAGPGRGVTSGARPGLGAGLRGQNFLPCFDFLSCFLRSAVLPFFWNFFTQLMEFDSSFLEFSPIFSGFVTFFCKFLLSSSHFVLFIFISSPLFGDFLPFSVFFWNFLELVRVLSHFPVCFPCFSHILSIFFPHFSDFSYISWKFL